MHSSLDQGSHREVRRAALVLIAGALALASAIACSSGGGAAEGLPAFVVDAAGRSVPIPASLDGGIVTIGSSGPLRFLSIFDVFEHVAQVDKGDVADAKHGRAYSYAFPYDEFSADRYHPDNKLEAETVERIAARRPALIVVQKSVYDGFREHCELLAGRFPLLVIHAQSMTELWDERYETAPWYRDTVRMLGDVLGRRERAEEHIRDMDAMLADVRSLVGESEKRVYVAGLTWQGSNELTTTFPAYLPLSLAGGRNAYAGSEAGRVVMDVEAIAAIPMDYLIIDPSSSDKLSTPNSQLILAWLYGRNNDADPHNDIRIFITLPMVWDSANYDCVIAGSYFFTKLLYGSLDDASLDRRIDETFRAFYGDRGSAVYPAMKAFFEEKSRAHGVELPMLGEALVERIGARYRLVAK